jgi:carboxymethylenebutenolidase
MEQSGLQPPGLELNMAGTTVDITTPDGVADAYLTGDGPGVLLLIDAFGLRPQIERMADRIAAEGYTVLAPNVFYRHQRGELLPGVDLRDPEQRGPAFEKVLPLVRSITPDMIASDATAFFEQLPEGKVGLTGYCMGGRLGWAIAAAHPDRVNALGCFHTGGLVTDGDDSPHKRAGELDAELYFGHADHDRSMTPENIAALDGALDEAGVDHTTEVYEGAPHGYTMADTASYDEAAAERHYTNLFALLGRVL